MATMVSLPRDHPGPPDHPATPLQCGGSQRVSDRDAELPQVSGPRSRRCTPGVAAVRDLCRSRHHGAVTWRDGSLPAVPGARHPKPRRPPRRAGVEWPGAGPPPSARPAPAPHSGIRPLPGRPWIMRSSLRCRPRRAELPWGMGEAPGPQDLWQFPVVCPVCHLVHERCEFRAGSVYCARPDCRNPTTESRRRCHQGRRREPARGGEGGFATLRAGC
jgi:hypothetical protein